MFKSGCRLRNALQTIPKRNFAVVQIVYTNTSKQCIENVVMNHFQHFVVNQESNPVLQQYKILLDFENNLVEQHFVQHLLANSGVQHLWIQHDGPNAKN
jgi:hypothetical protein